MRCLVRSRMRGNGESGGDSPYRGAVATSPLLRVEACWRRRPSRETSGNGNSSVSTIVRTAGEQANLSLSFGGSGALNFGTQSFNNNEWASRQRLKPEKLGTASCATTSALGALCANAAPIGDLSVNPSAISAFQRALPASADRACAICDMRLRHLCRLPERLRHR